MINMECVSAEILRMAEYLDGTVYPEASEYLGRLVRQDGMVEEMPYGIADTLIKCDRPKRFPGVLIGFIKEMYKLEIAEGNDDAMNDLGAAYYDGDRGFPQDFGKAVHYYKMAADHGNRQAQENLGYCYYYGRDMEAPDYKKAFHYFLLGALDGHLISLYKIGDMYLNGYYVEKNEKEAYHIYRHCLDMMTEEAERFVAGPVYLRISNMFLHGTGTEENPKNALVCFQKAEFYLYDMVAAGDYKYKKSLRNAIKGQQEAREKLEGKLTEEEWIDE